MTFTEDQIKFCEEKAQYFNNTGGNPIRELLTDGQNHWFSNAPRAAIVEATKAQASMLLKLKEDEVKTLNPTRVPFTERTGILRVEDKTLFNIVEELGFTLYIGDGVITDAFFDELETACEDIINLGYSRETADKLAAVVEEALRLNCTFIEFHA